MTAKRERLPNRRASESFSFEREGLRFTATVSLFADGRIGELFLNNHKSGNQLDTNARDAAIILSFAVQHGADIDSNPQGAMPGQPRPRARADRPGARSIGRVMTAEREREHFDTVAQNLAECIVDLLKAPRDRDRLLELVKHHLKRALSIGYRAGAGR
jgi:hypothetical protein